MGVLFTSACCTKRDDEQLCLNQLKCYSFKDWQQLKKETDAKKKKEEVKRVFKLIDNDGNGKITKKELREFFENMKGLNRDDKEQDTVDKIFRTIDEDGSNIITVTELYEYMK